jgi:hypothetical protein
MTMVGIVVPRGASDAHRCEGVLAPSADRRLSGGTRLLDLIVACRLGMVGPTASQSRRSERVLCRGHHRVGNLSEAWSLGPYEADRHARLVRLFTADVMRSLARSCTSTAANRTVAP